MNRKSIARFVLESVRPGAKPVLPEFAQDAEAWQAALDFSVRIHALLPFLFSLQRHADYSRLPDAIQIQVKEKLGRERMALALLDHEFAHALHLLNEKGIPVIVVKGMDLGRRFYPERLLRPMTDVDLLVSPEQFPDAVDCLISHGYQSVGVHYAGRFRMELCRGEGASIIELHRQLLKGDAHRIAGMWERSLPGNFSDLPGPVRVLGVEDCLIYLMEHAAVQHLIESPIWLNDLHYVIVGAERDGLLNWQVVCDGLGLAEANTAIWFLLLLLKTYTGTPIPDSVIARFSSRVGFLRRLFLLRTLSGENWFSYHSRGWGELFFRRFVLKDSVLQAVRYLFARQLRGLAGG